MGTKLLYGYKQLIFHQNNDPVLVQCKKCGGEVCLSWPTAEEGWRFYRVLVDNLEIGQGDGYTEGLYCCDCKRTGKATGWEVMRFPGNGTRNPELQKVPKNARK